MAAILSYLSDQAAFEPEAVTAMSKAFEDVCAALRVQAGDDRGRDIIATRIIDLARSGEADAKALRDWVLSEAKSDA